MSPEQQAICGLLSSLIDMYQGWPVRELHEPLQLTVQRALKLLPENVQQEFDIPQELQ